MWGLGWHINQEEKLWRHHAHKHSLSPQNARRPNIEKPEKNQNYYEKNILIHLLWRKFHHLTEVKQGFLQYFWHFFLYFFMACEKKEFNTKSHFILEKEEIRWLCNIIFNIVITGYDLEEADMKTHAFWDFVYERIPNKKSLKPSIEGRYMLLLFSICLNNFLRSISWKFKNSKKVSEKYCIKCQRKVLCSNINLIQTFIVFDILCTFTENLQLQGSINDV